MDKFLKQLGNSKKKSGENGNTAWGRGKSAPQHLREKRWLLLELLPAGSAPRLLPLVEPPRTGAGGERPIHLAAAAIVAWTLPKATDSTAYRNRLSTRRGYPPPQFTGNAKKPASHNAETYDAHLGLATERLPPNYVI
ncbi:hypothetical protein TNCV_992451 [Trichonephila clavipes]|nr:hypothetical protein TNCV_992451 [Trichonephila clavipes]